MDEQPPMLMRLWSVLPIPVIRSMDMAADWGRARAGERWACMCGSLFGRGYMIPMWKEARADG
jgi:hypothetical protein